LTALERFLATVAFSLAPDSSLWLSISNIWMKILLHLECLQKKCFVYSQKGRK
jgi:hypothetical protein